MEPSSLADATTWYIGCIATLVILYLCPNNVYFSGCLGKPSPTAPIGPDPPWMAPAPPPHLSHICYSLSCLFYFSSSMTYFFNFATEVHFFSRTSFIKDTEPPLFWGLPSFAKPVSPANISADYRNLFLTKYSCIAMLSSSFYFEVNPTIFIVFALYK